jgi:hypothetical protein
VVDGLHTHTQNRIMKPLAIALNGVGRGLQERVDAQINLINVGLFGIVTMNPPPFTMNIT